MDFPSFLLDACCHHETNADLFYNGDDLTENDLSLSFKEGESLNDISSEIFATPERKKKNRGSAKSPSTFFSNSTSSTPIRWSASAASGDNNKINKNAIGLWEEHQENISKTKTTTPATVKTLDTAMDTDNDENSPNTTLETPTESNHNIIKGVVPIGATRAENKIPSATNKAAQSLNVQRVLSFSGATANEHAALDPLPMTPQTSLNNNNKPLVPPSAVAATRQRPSMMPAVAAAAVEEEEQDAAFTVADDASGFEAMPKTRPSLVSTLVAKMNAANAYLRATVVHENTKDDEDDEWSQDSDSLMNMTDSENEEDDVEEPSKTATATTKESTEELFELFASNMFQDGQQEKSKNANATTNATTAASTPKPQEQVVANKLVSQVRGASGPTAQDDHDSDSSSSDGLPIIFDDEFGDLPEGEIFSQEDFGLTQEEEKKQDDDELLEHEKSTKKKKRSVGGSLKKKITSMLKKKKDNYGSLKDDNLEKKTTLVSESSKNKNQQARTTAKPSAVKEPQPVAAPIMASTSTVVAASPNRVPKFTISPPRITTAKSEDSFPIANDPWSTETTEAAFPLQPTLPTMVPVKSPPGSPIKPSKQDTPPYHPNSPPSQQVNDDSWEQLLQSVTDKQEDFMQQDPAWIIPIADESDIAFEDTDSDALPVQFSNGFFAKEASALIQDSRIHVIPNDEMPPPSPQEESLPAIDTSTVFRPSVLPKRRVTGVANTKAIFEGTSTNIKKPPKQAPKVVSPDRKDIAEKEEEKEVAPSVQALTDAFDVERPKMVNRKVKAWEHSKAAPTDQTAKPATATTPRQSRPSMQVVSKTNDEKPTPVRSTSLPKRVVSTEQQRARVISPDRPVPKLDKATSVQDLTDAFDKERTPKMVNRKVKAFEREHSSEKPETRRSSSLTKRTSSGEKEANSRSSSLTKRVVPAKATPPLPKKSTPPPPANVPRKDILEPKVATAPRRTSNVGQMATTPLPKKATPPAPANVPRKDIMEPNSTTAPRRASNVGQMATTPLPKKTTPPAPANVPRKDIMEPKVTTAPRRTSNVGQMANKFDPPTYSKENVNKLAGAFEKETKVFQKPNRTPTNKAAPERPPVKRSFSSNAIPSKAPITPAPLAPRASEAMSNTDAEKAAKRSDLFNYWQKVAVTTKSTPMPSEKATNENASNDIMAVDTSFEFSDPDVSGAPTLDEKAWANVGPEGPTIFSL